jgi:hypothetical protein
LPSGPVGRSPPTLTKTLALLEVKTSIRKYLFSLSGMIENEILD